jgi:chromate transporter
MKETWLIFSTFFKIGLLAFGGGYTILPLLQKDIVQTLNWSTYEDIMDYYAISQSLPGLISVNIAMIIGYERRKIPGLFLAAAGVIMPSIIVILTIAVFMDNILHFAFVRNAFNGIRVAVAVLIMNAAIDIWKSCVKDKTRFLIFLAAFLVFSFIDISPIFPIISGAAAGIIVNRGKAV